MQHTEAGRLKNKMRALETKPGSRNPKPKPQARKNQATKTMPTKVGETEE